MTGEGAAPRRLGQQRARVGGGRRGRRGLGGERRAGGGSPPRARPPARRAPAAARPAAPQPAARRLPAAVAACPPLQGERRRVGAGRRAAGASGRPARAQRRVWEACGWRGACRAPARPPAAAATRRAPAVCWPWPAWQATNGRARRADAALEEAATEGWRLAPALARGWCTCILGGLWLCGCSRDGSRGARDARWQSTAREGAAEP
jgi:hypothetical protein